MRDFWDGLARTLGYEYWAWGTAADWVGALGTAGAFFFGFYLLMGEKKKDERRLADGFATWHEFVEKNATSGPKTYDAIVHAHNSTETPVPIAWIREVSRTGEFHVKSTILGQKTANGYTISPGKATSVVLGGFASPDIGERYVQFADGAGREWVRSLRTGQYLQGRQARAILRRVHSQSDEISSR